MAAWGPAPRAGRGPPMALVAALAWLVVGQGQAPPEEPPAVGGQEAAQAAAGGVYAYPDQAYMKAMFERLHRSSERDLEDLSEREMLELLKALEMTKLRIAIEKHRREPQWQGKMAKWRDFLTGTAHERLLQQRECTYRMDWLGSLGALVVPRLKLAVCYIPKVACTALKDLFNTLNGIEKAPLGFGAGYLLSDAASRGVDPASMTKENNWTFVAFTRDPLERYLSAYGSTCVQRSEGKADHPMECCGMMVSNAAPSEVLVEQFERRAVFDRDVGLPHEEQHFAPQVQVLHNCGWEQFAPEKLDYHGHLSAGDMNRQVREFMGLVEATEEDLALVDRFFPADRGSVLNPNPINASKRQFYAKQAVRDAVRQVYAIDYDLIPDLARHSSVDAVPATA